MVKRPTSQGKKPSRHDANSPVSATLTAKVIHEVQKLPDCLRTVYLKDQFLDKFVSDDTDPASVRRQRAINKWLATERNNEATNDRLLTTHDTFNVMDRVRWSSFLEFAQRLVVRIIGETVPVDALIGSFSGGASTSRTRTESHPASKYLGQADATPAALDLFSLITDEIPGWMSHEKCIQFNTVSGNVLFTVPKNTTIDRVACKEPDINMFLQKGIGTYIRTRLQSVGINLNDQSRNRELARQGSVTGLLATLDLSSASDSVSYSLVEQLMPPLWFDVLRATRSPITVIDGEEHVNEMFSSMGNGYTFELESLIFYVLTRTTAYFRGISGTVSVYGDDIICPSTLAPDLIRVLDHCGFEVNTSKSFWTGSFRESCGGHFYNGVDVTPFYLKKPIKRLTDLIHIANAVRLWAGRLNIGVLDPTVEALWLWLKSLIPSRFWGGREFSSIGQLVSPDPVRSRLLPVVVERPVHTGCYIHWLNTTWWREKSGEAVETSLVTEACTRYRARSCRSESFTDTRSYTPFISEV